jgi:protein involved in polysaccharide export with SLBB domain
MPVEAIEGKTMDRGRSVMLFREEGSVRRWGVLGAMVMAAGLAGCADNVREPTSEQLAAFRAAGSITPTVDMERIRKAKLSTGPYRVICGDVLEFTMPALLQAVTTAKVQAAQTQTRTDQPYLARICTRGTITLPAVGELSVAGHSLAEIEEMVMAAYRPYVVLQPSVFIRVPEYMTSKVYITGAVKKPGVYTLRADQMTLVSLLTVAEGIAETGASLVRIVRSSEDSPASADTSTENSSPSGAAGGGERGLVLPVVGMNIPFHDVALEEGDTVVVEQGQVPLFSVLGLVRTPGNFPYPPNAKYNITQAIAFAGGLDPITDPHYATVYRMTPEGTVVRVPFRLIQHSQFTEALGTLIRPGDVVAVEHTLRTRMNAAIANLVRINLGLYLTGNDLWDNNN